MSVEILFVGSAAGIMATLWTLMVVAVRNAR